MKEGDKMKRKNGEV